MQQELSFSTRDEFSRKIIADKLIMLLKSDIELSPIVINGDWGTGKTEFCLKTIKEIEHNNELKCIYIDAFNADSSDEPILTLISAIVSLLPDTEIKNSIISTAIPVIKYASKVLLNAGTTIILKENAEKLGEGLTDALKNETSTAIDATINNLLNAHEKATENIAALRESLEILSKQDPVIIFIDELDRCRPNYALKIIESIKHIFNVRNVKFVLITNIGQLSSSINKVYGDSINASRYLDKFIGFKIDLPEFHRKFNFDKNHNSVVYFTELAKNDRLSVFLIDSYSAFISYLIENFRLSLRDVEKFVKHLDIYQFINSRPITEKSGFLTSLLKIIGIFLYSTNLKLKERFLFENYTCEDIISFFSICINENRKYSGYSIIEKIVINILVCATDYEEYKSRHPDLINYLQASWSQVKDGYTAGDFGNTKRSDEYIVNTIHSFMLI